MTNKITLNFPTTINRLAGNHFGVETYNNQVKENINYSKKNIIIIPEYIEDVAISFVQGFTQEIFNKIKKDEFDNYFEIQAKDKVRNKFIKSIYF